MPLSVLVTAFCALLSLGFFVLDNVGYFSTPNRPIAKLEAYEGSVRRLPRGEPMWDRSWDGALFANFDTVSTGENSSATLKLLEKGVTLRLGEGTTLTLGQRADELQLKILTGRALVRVSAAAHGTVRVTQPGHDDEVLVPSQMPLKSTAKDFEPEGVSIEVVEPDHFAKSTELESPTPSFAQRLTQPVESEKVRDMNLALHSQEELIDFAQLPPVPHVLEPADGMRFEFSSAPVELHLRWELDPVSVKNEGALGFEVTLKNKDGVERSYRSSGPEFVLKKPAEGTYSWTVRALSQNGRRGAAEPPRAFSVSLLASRTPQSEVSTPAARSTRTKKARDDKYQILPVKVE